MRKTSFGVQVATLTYRTQHIANVQNKLAAVGHKETEARSEFLILVVATRIYTHTSEAQRTQPRARGSRVHTKSCTCANFLC